MFFFLNDFLCLFMFLMFLTFFGCRTDELKWGELVGADKFGNKYYQNKMYFMGKNALLWNILLVLKLRVI